MIADYISLDVEMGICRGRTIQDVDLDCHLGPKVFKMICCADTCFYPCPLFPSWRMLGGGKGSF